ncbi:MAG: hypothetical protein ABI969_09050 [bacterium]
MTDFPTFDDNHGGHDFGEDADVVLPTDPEFDAWIAAAAPALNVPPTTPRLDMWDAIQAAQQTSSAAQAGSIAGVTSLRRPRWLMPVLIAAALLIGVGIDRYAIRTTPEPRVTNPQAVASTPTQPRAGAARDSTDPSGLYRLAAVQTLTQAEALLTAYRANDVATRNPAAARQLGTWGREVLSSTRLLLDSPAGDDPTLRPLLNDIELVLVQIIRLSGAPLDSSERVLIDGAMRERALLPRIRSAVPAGVASAASDE